MIGRGLHDQDGSFGSSDKVSSTLALVSDSRDSFRWVGFEISVSRTRVEFVTFYNSSLSNFDSSTSMLFNSNSKLFLGFSKMASLFNT